MRINLFVYILSVHICSMKLGLALNICILFHSVCTLFALPSCAEQKNQNAVMMADTNMNDSNTASHQTETATFGNGCFWCTEAFFQRVNGVEKVVSGYSGGKAPYPSYEQVGTGATGYVEVVQVTYDPAKVSFDDLLEVFWKTHDPTTLNRQGNDVGTQYRSVIFYHTDEQKQTAEHYKEELNKSGAWNKPVVTAVEPFTNFYAAENYHQNYYNNNPRQMYCQYVIRPKLEKFEKVFKEEMKVH